MPELISVGELLIDLTQTAVGGDGIRHYAANPGGAPANVAVAAARLGLNAGFIGKVGADTFGRDLRRTLEENAVDTHGLCETAEAPTTVAVVSVDTGGERTFTFFRSPGADTLLTAGEVDAVWTAGPAVLHAGSVSLTAEPARTATMRAVSRAREEGALVSYDPNYRANLWPDEETAVAQMRAPLAFADLVKVSDEELPLLTGTEDLEEGSRRLMEYGASLVLVTLGGRGAFYRLGGLTGLVPGFRVTVADTNGAGDTFLGALLSRLIQEKKPLCSLMREELEACLRFANGAAALTCSRSGAIPAMPTLDEVETFLGEESV